MSTSSAPARPGRFGEFGGRYVSETLIPSPDESVGILTDRDLRRAAASDAPPMAEHELLYLLDKLYVRDIMTPEVVTVSVMCRSSQENSSLV